MSWGFALVLFLSNNLHSLGVYLVHNLWVWLYLNSSAQVMWLAWQVVRTHLANFWGFRPSFQSLPNRKLQWAAKTRPDFVRLKDLMPKEKHSRVGLRCSAVSEPESPSQESPNFALGRFFTVPQVLNPCALRGRGWRTWSPLCDLVTPRPSWVGFQGGEGFHWRATLPPRFFYSCSFCGEKEGEILPTKFSSHVLSCPCRSLSVSVDWSDLPQNFQAMLSKFGAQGPPGVKTPLATLAKILDLPLGSALGFWPGQPQGPVQKGCGGPPRQQRHAHDSQERHPSKQNGVFRGWS